MDSSVSGECAFSACGITLLKLHNRLEGDIFDNPIQWIGSITGQKYISNNNGTIMSKALLIFSGGKEHHVSEAGVKKNGIVDTNQHKFSDIFFKAFGRLVQDSTFPINVGWLCGTLFSLRSLLIELDRFIRNVGEINLGLWRRTLSN